MRNNINEFIQYTDPRIYLGLGTVIASVATSGSLYFSVGLNLTPCPLCWYQRILMYTLPLSLGIATYDSYEKIYRSTLPLTIIGVGIASYHSYLQWAGVECSINGLCGAILWSSPFIGLTIPNLSLIAFTLITILLSLVAYSQLNS